jgi:hypothetical protein
MGAFPRLGPMLTEAQIQYITEVLGAPIEAYLKPVGHVLPEAVSILTPRLGSNEERLLLDRILASANLKEAPVYEFESVPDFHAHAEALSARHALVFSREVPYGRHQHDGITVWGLHGLDSMIGQGPEVARAKKAVWDLLQQFNRERLLS